MTAGARVLCVVQARMGSTRLPGKVLQELGGRPMLRFMLDRLAGLEVDELVVATSALARDDAVAEVARAADRRVVRDSEDDVLARFVAALDASPAEHVVRLTADCPLMDPELVRAVLARHHECAADYTCNVLPRTFPKGLDVEVVRADVLRAAAEEAIDQAEREHVTPFVYRRPERFRLASLRNDEWLGNERWTVDTPADLAFVRNVVGDMGGDRFPWTDALKVVGERYVAPGGSVVLVPAAAAHCAFVLACRNDADAVRWSRTGRAITPADHERWYASTIDDPGIRLSVALIDGEPVGTVRVDVEGGVGEIGVAVALAHRGCGRGRALIGALVDDCAADQQVVRLVARVHPENRASMRAFESAGFVGDRDGSGFRVLRRDVARARAALPSGQATPIEMT